MTESKRLPEMIVIAGPNGSGKTSVTQKFLHHEWAEGTLYINPDEVAKDKYGDWNSPEAVLRSCFEFLQKVFLGLMYPFSCVLWAIFWSFSLLFFVR